MVSRTRMLRLSPREQNVLRSRSTTNFPNEDDASKSTIGNTKISNSYNGILKAQYSRRPGDGRAIAYQNQMRSLGNLHTQDYSGLTQEHLTGTHPPKPGQAQLDVFVRTEYDRFDFDPVGLEDSADALNAIAQALWTDKLPDVKNFGKEVSTCWKAKKLSDDVGKKMTLLFGKAGNKDNVWQNAIKHALWSYQLTQEFGAEKAKRITDAHERGQAQTLEVIMDLHNNEIGRELALDANNKGRSPLSVIWESYRAGDLQLTPPDPRGRKVN